MQNPRIRKLANAFIPDATPSPSLPGSAFRTVDRFGRRWGGLWVGGSVDISPEEISFTPNNLNRAFHVDLEPIHIASENVISVRHEFGWFTGIVVVTHAAGEFRFRCYGAKQLVATISRNLGAA